MRVRKVWRAGVVGLLLGFVALSVSGCLNGSKTVIADYDAAKDQFRFLTLIQHIVSSQDPGQDLNDHGGAQRDFDWVKTLYNNRDHMIFVPIRGDFMGGSGAFLRLSDSEYVTVNLGGRDDKFTSERTTIPLNDITIKPGKFFRPAPDNLCYYHEDIVPGKVADASLAALAHSLSLGETGSIVEAISQELVHRSKGETVMSWSNFDHLVISASQAMINGQPLDAASPSCPLDTKSLEIFKAALMAERIPITRQGRKVSILAEVTAKDVAGLLDFDHQFRSAVSVAWAKCASTQPIEKQGYYEGCQDFLNSVTVTADDATHLRVTVDAIAAINAGAKMSLTDEGPLTGDLQKRAKDMADAVQKEFGACGGLAVDDVIADFHTDSLKTNPSANVLQPGTGMGTITAATEPSTTQQ